MKIRSVSYERLFNLHDFNNEKFRFDAELGEKEDSKNSMVELAGMVIEIHDLFEEYRDLVRKLKNSEEQLAYAYRELESTEGQLHKEQEKIHEMRAKGQDEYEIACFVKSIKELREDKQEKDRKIKDLEVEIKGLRVIRDSFKARLKEGKLFEGS